MTAATPDLTRGSCVGHDAPHMWDASVASDDEQQYAVAICRGCPVQDACAAWGRQVGAGSGLIYGGDIPKSSRPLVVIHIEWAAVEVLARRGASIPEVSAHLGVNKATLHKRIQKEGRGELRDLFVANKARKIKERATKSKTVDYVALRDRIVSALDDGRDAAQVCVDLGRSPKTIADRLHAHGDDELAAVFRRVTAAQRRIRRASAA